MSTSGPAPNPPTLAIMLRQSVPPPPAPDHAPGEYTLPSSLGAAAPVRLQSSRWIGKIKALLASPPRLHASQRSRWRPPRVHGVRRARPATAPAHISPGRRASHPYGGALRAGGRGGTRLRGSGTHHYRRDTHPGRPAAPATGSPRDAPGE